MELREDYHQIRKTLAESKARQVEAPEISDALNAVPNGAKISKALKKQLLKLADVATEGETCGGSMEKVAASFGGEQMVFHRIANLIDRATCWFKRS